MESKEKSQGVLRGAMILAIAVFVSRLIGLIYKIPINNVLGDDGMSIYAGAYNVYALLLTFSAIGVPAAISKLVSERIAVGRYNEAFRVFKIALFYFTLIGIVSCFLLFVGAEYVSLFITGNTSLMMPLRALSPALVVVSIIAIMRGYFQGMGNMVPPAASQVIEQIFNAVVAVSLAYMLIPNGTVAAATGTTFGPTIGSLASFVFLSAIYFRFHKSWQLLRKEEKKNEEALTPQKESRGSILKQVLFLVIPILLTSSIFSITTTIDQKMLYTQLPQSIAVLESEGKINQIPVSGLEDGNVDVDQVTASLVGQYLSKYVTILNLPISLIIQLATAAMPALAGAMMLKHYDELREKVYLVLKTGMMLAIPSAIGLTVFGMEIVPVLFRGAPDGGELIMYGAIGIIPMSLAQLTSGMLQGMGKQRIPVCNALIACMLKIILNAILLTIPSLHILAVVYSTIICYIVYAYLNLRELTKLIELKINWTPFLIKPFLAAVVMGIGAYAIYYGIMLVVPVTALALAIAVGIAMGIYGIVLVLIGGVTKAEVQTLPMGYRLAKLMRLK